MKYPLVVCLCAALLAACGGGGTADELPAKRTLQLFGDSTQRDAAPTYSQRLGARLIDSAVAGTRSGQLVDGTDGLNKPWPQSVVGDVLLINHALNDSVVVALIDPEVYRANLRRLADAPGIVVFETPNPVIDPIRDPAPYAQIMREVAAERGLQVVDVYACMLARANWPALLRDGTHPSDAGYAFIVDVCVLPELAKVIRPTK